MQAPHRGIKNAIKLLFIILLLFAGFYSFSQSILIDTLILSKNHSFSQKLENDLRFPVIKTGNNKIDSLLNTDLKNRYTNFEFPDLPADQALFKWADDIIVYLDFNVTYLKNNLISLN